MMTNSQARKSINDKIKQIGFIQQSRIQWANQPNFKIPETGLWIRVTIQYAGSVPSGLYRGLLERDVGVINFQCFARKGSGDFDLVKLTDDIRDHFKGFRDRDFEVTMTNAPTEAIDDVQGDFVMSLVRVEFRVN